MKAEDLIEDLVGVIQKDDELMQKMKSSINREDKWKIMNSFVKKNCSDDIILQYEHGFVREAVMWELQQNGIDMGFCKFFDSDYKELAISRETKGMVGKIKTCSHSGKVYETVCDGFAQDYCVILKKKNVISRALED